MLIEKMPLSVIIESTVRKGNLKDPQVTPKKFERSYEIDEEKLNQLVIKVYCQQSKKIDTPPLLSNVLSILKAELKEELQLKIIDPSIEHLRSYHDRYQSSAPLNEKEHFSHFVNGENAFSKRSVEETENIATEVVTKIVIEFINSFTFDELKLILDREQMTYIHESKTCNSPIQEVW